MDTHYFGTLSVVRGFAPQIAANGGGAILNILSGWHCCIAPSLCASGHDDSNATLVIW